MCIRHWATGEKEAEDRSDLPACPFKWETSEGGPASNEQELAPGGVSSWFDKPLCYPSMREVSKPPGTLNRTQYTNHKLRPTLEPWRRDGQSATSSKRRQRETCCYAQMYKKVALTLPTASRQMMMSATPGWSQPEGWVPTLPFHTYCWISGFMPYAAVRQCRTVEGATTLR